MVNALDLWKTKTEIWRERFCKPLLRNTNFHPHTITTLRLFLALGFPLLIISYSVIAWILISLSIILDGFDGTVARYNNIATDRGKFIDVLADQITFTLLCLGLIRLLPEFSLILATCSIFIPLAYLMTMVYKNEKKPSDWLLRPQATLTVYKIIFIVIIISYLFNILPYTVIQVALWLESIVAALHFYWNYDHFVKINT